ncbi:hypothetical protein [Arthrobacter pigmenti]
MTKGSGNQPHRTSRHVSETNTEGPYNAGLAVFSYIIGGIIVWTLIGWGLDNLLGTRWIVLAGAILGAAGGFYLAFAHGLTRHTAKYGDSRSSDPVERPHQ